MNYQQYQSTNIQTIHCSSVQLDLGCEDIFILFTPFNVSPWFVVNHLHLLFVNNFCIYFLCIV